MKTNKFYVFLLMFLTIFHVFPFVAKSEDREMERDKYDQEVPVMREAPVMFVEVLFRRPVSEDRRIEQIERVEQIISDFEGQRFVTFKDIKDMSHGDFIVEVMERVGVRPCLYLPLFWEGLDGSVCDVIRDKMHRKLQEMEAGLAR